LVSFLLRVIRSRGDPAESAPNRPAGGALCAKGPGLGLEWDEKAIARFAPVIREIARHRLTRSARPSRCSDAHSPRSIIRAGRRPACGGVPHKRLEIVFAAKVDSSHLLLSNSKAATRSFGVEPLRQRRFRLGDDAVEDDTGRLDIVDQIGMVAPRNSLSAACTVPVVKAELSK